jgi:hypothetical protein
MAGPSGGFPGVSANLDMFLGSGYTAIVLSNYSNGGMPMQIKLQQLILANQEARPAK